MFSIESPLALDSLCRLQQSHSLYCPLHWIFVVMNHIALFTSAKQGWSCSPQNSASPVYTLSPGLHLLSDSDRFCLWIIFWPLLHRGQEVQDELTLFGNNRARVFDLASITSQGFSQNIITKTAPVDLCFKSNRSKIIWLPNGANSWKHLAHSCNETIRQHASIRSLMGCNECCPLLDSLYLLCLIW